jgi:hypothetical protein
MIFCEIVIPALGIPDEGRQDYSHIGRSGRVGGR